MTNKIIAYSTKERRSENGQIGHLCLILGLFGFNLDLPGTEIGDKDMRVGITPRKTGKET